MGRTVGGGRDAMDAQDAVCDVTVGPGRTKGNEMRTDAFRDKTPRGDGTARSYVDSATERQLQDTIVAAARRLDWFVYHCYDSRKSPEGWPDLFLLKGEKAIAYECKTATGRLRPMQADWLARLNDAGIPARVIRPADLDDVFNELREDGKQ